MDNPIKKRKAKKKAAAEAAGKRSDELLAQGQSRIKALKKADLSKEKSIAENKASLVAGASSEPTNWRKTREMAKNFNAAGGEGMQHAGMTNVQVSYDSRSNTAPVGGGTKKQVAASKRKALRNKDRSKQARESDKRRYAR